MWCMTERLDGCDSLLGDVKEVPYAKVKEMSFVHFQCLFYHHLHHVAHQQVPSFFNQYNHF